MSSYLISFFYFYHGRLWAAKTGKCKHVFDGPTAHQGMVTCIAGSEDGDLIMTGESTNHMQRLRVVNLM